MKLLLLKEGNWTVISEEKPEEEENAVDWNNRNDQAMATIGLAVEDSQLIHIRKAKSAAEAWKNLETFHVKRTLTTKVSLMRKICRLRLERGGDMEAHISRLTELFEKLNNLQEDKILDDHWLVAILFSSLPDEYETLVTALEARPDEDLTLNLAKGKLLDEWQKRKNRSEDDDDAETALHARSSASSVVKCFFCKKSGHKKFECEKYKDWKKNKDTKQEEEKVNSVVNAPDEDCHWAFVAASSTSTEGLWLLDSGATCHIVNHRDFFDNLDDTVREVVYVANGAKVVAKGRGRGVMKVVDDKNRCRVITVEEALFVPEMNTNLLSVKMLVRKGYVVTFDSKGATIARDGVVGAYADLKHNLFVMRVSGESASLVQKGSDCVHGWHRRLGHRNCDAIVKLCELADGFDVAECKCNDVCEVCVRGKMHRSPFPKESESKSSAVLDLVHTDICGPMRTATLGGRKYFLTFTDDYSRYTVVYIVRRKSETLEKIKEFVEMAKTQFGRKPKILRSDRGGEYIGNQVRNYLKSNGIVGQLTVPYSPQQNGVAERKNRYIVEMARCMLIDAKLDDRFWGEAVVTANHMQNRLPSRSIQGTPYERWFGRKPDLSDIRPFGIDVYCHVPKQKRGKLDEKAVKLKFMGYSEDTKGYRLVDVHTGKVTISRDVRFLNTFDPIKKSEENEVVVPLHVSHPRSHQVVPEDIAVITDDEPDDDPDDFWVDTECFLDNNPNDDEPFQDPLN